MTERWRTGTSPGTHGRTIYRHVDGGPERGELIGLMDDAYTAGRVVEAVNHWLAADRKWAVEFRNGLLVRRLITTGPVEEVPDDA